VAPDPVAAPAAPVATPAPATSAAAPAVPERRGGPRGLAVASGSLAAVAGGFTAVVGVGVLAALGPGERPSTAIKERGLAPLIPGLAASGGAALGFGALAIVFAAVGGEQVEADLAGLTVRF
jgi:hypothetical protein